VKPPRVTYLVHGEPAAADALALAIKTRYGWTVHVARAGQAVGIA
jgi:metallo-beta-lactamase family protein